MENNSIGMQKSTAQRGFMVNLFTVSFLLNMFTHSVVAEPETTSRFKVLQSDADSMILELTVDDFLIKTREHGGNTYHQVIIPHMGQSAEPGKPGNPLRGVMIGLPTIDDVSVRVLDTQYEVRSGYYLCPCPKIVAEGDTQEEIAAKGAKQIFVQDQEVYSRNQYYPDKIVQVGSVGYMRDQPVAQIQFHPVQFNPVTRELRLYNRMLVEVTWNTHSSPGIKKVKRTIRLYENVLKNTLINYRSLQRDLYKEEIRQEGEGDKKRADKTENVTKDEKETSLKISIEEEGIYKITYDELINAGYKIDEIDPRKIKITNLGTEVSIYVSGEEDGVFDATDYILFYGTQYQDTYTDKNVYWLTTDEKDGERMSIVDGSVSGNASVPSYFPDTFHAEEDTYYWQTMPDGEGEDHWFWGNKLSAPEAEDYSFSLPNISPSADTATVRVTLKGRTDITNTDPDHHTKIYVNDNEIDDQYWNGQVSYEHAVIVPHSILESGTNTVQVESVGDTGASVDQVFVNWIEIDYFGTYIAQNDELAFGTPSDGTFQFELDGFSTNDVQIFEVSEPTQVQFISNTSFSQNSDGTYTIKFEKTVQEDSRFLSLSSAQYKSPAEIEIDQLSSWKTTDNGADYIIITHKDFYDNAVALADHRSDAGLRVVTVKVDDIYDEFNYGIFNPQAIQDFLTYAYDNWAGPAPVYVLLIGDAYQDYKDNLETGTINYVPSQIIETDELGETPSDNWFVLVSGDDIIPDMLIGRLSAQSEEQVDDIIHKIIYYEQHPSEDLWSKTALLVADDDDASFESLSEEIAELFPDNFITNKVYAADYTVQEDITQDIANHINNGCVVINYTGHGSSDMWGLSDSDSMFTTDDIALLENTHTLPVVTVADCLNGFFTGRNTKTCVAEAFQRLEDKGAIAVWAATALSYTSGHRLLMLSFYESIFKDSDYNLGEITTKAKIEAYSESSFWGELVETFVLFGDPAMEIHVSSGDSCTAESIETSQSKLALQKGDETEIVVTVSCADGTPLENVKVKTKMKKGKKKVVVSSETNTTDGNGQIYFTVSGKKKGKAVVLFRAEDLKAKLIVKVKK